MADGVPFGNYRLQRRLARGGMAEVFLALHLGVEGFERRVAIKRILPHLSDSEEFRSMFLDEARLAAQLTHPNVVHVYDFGKVEDYYFIAMELLDGVDLGRMIRQAKQRPIPFEHAARILADACGGLHYAHNLSDANGRKLNVVHRDVTPQNVLVTYDGVVKLVDFGIAKATWQAGRTRPGVVKGKYAYMSPEQVEGRPLDARSDVFSAGICLYELLCGVPLFRRDDVTEAMKEIRDGKPLRPEEHRPDVPAELVSILKKALATSREARYSSAAEMQLALERYLKSLSVLSTPQLLGAYISREHPRLPVEEAPATERTAPGASGARQVGTTRERSIRSGVRAPGSGSHSTPGIDVDSAELDPAFTTPGKGSAIAASAGRNKLRSGSSPSLRPERTEPERQATTQPERASLRSAATGTAPVDPIEDGPSLRPRGFLLASTLAGGTALAVAAFIALRPADPVPIEPSVEPPPPAAAARAAGPPQAVSTPLIVPQAPVATPLDPAAQAPPEPSAPASPVTTALATAPAAPRPTIDVLSSPEDARVTVDDVALEALTPIRAHQLSPGSHQLAIERRGFQPRKLSLQLAEGEHRTVKLELHPVSAKVSQRAPAANGFLSVRTIPWSRVFEGSRLVGVTPLANIPLSEGTHTLTFVNPELPPITRTVMVKSGSETRLSLELKK